MIIRYFRFLLAPIRAAKVAFASSDGNGSNDGDESNEDDDTDDDTVTDLPSSKLQFDSDDDSYDEDRHFSQQASFFN